MSSDIWTEKEIGLFLKYCPNKRDRCYLAMAYDMSARPSEILNLKIKDILFKISEEGIQYAEVEIKGGKTGTRTVPLIDSLPYVKDWIENSHPNGNNPESWLFVSLAKTNYGSKLTYDGLLKHYKEFYKNKYFPQLVLDNSIPQVDRSFIRNILTKPFCMYIFRHSALTQKSIILKEHMLRSHAGWSINSKMPQVYLHYFGNESSQSLLELKGVIKKKGIDSNNILRSRYCPNCNEPNIPEAKWCMKCKMVLSYNSYIEALENERKKEGDILELKSQYEEMNHKIQMMFELID